MTIELLQNRIDQIGLALEGISCAITTQDPLWCLEWQKARALWHSEREFKYRYEEAIRRVKGYGGRFRSLDGTWSGRTCRSLIRWISSTGCTG
jgi:hypothetical protein